MTLEAVMGCMAAFDPRLHAARGHAGQMRVAEDIRKMTDGSSLVDATGRIQDAYSLRCAPSGTGNRLGHAGFCSKHHRNRGQRRH